jgi:hypothetical protein
LLNWYVPSRPELTPREREPVSLVRRMLVPVSNSRFEASRTVPCKEPWAEDWDTPKPNKMPDKNRNDLRFIWMTFGVDFRIRHGTASSRENTLIRRDVK